MQLEAVIDDQVYTLEVPDPLLAQAGEFFDQLDRDMDGGWQMSRDWVSAPDQMQRAQIVADKLLTALEKENQKLGLLMAGYLLQRLPGLTRVELDVQGEIQNNQFSFAAKAPADAQEDPAILTLAGADRGAPSGLGKLDAMAQAGQDVSQVFKVGKGYRFSVFNHSNQSWQDGPLLKTREEADRLRQQAFTRRYEWLCRQA